VAIAAPTPAGAVSSQTASYDALNRLTASTWTPTPAQATPTASTASFAFAYNGANQRVGQTATDNSFWSYPAATPSTVAYAPNALDQYATIGSVTPTYDGNGNLTYDGTFTYGYDAESRLISASGAGNSASYAYDALGRRKSKTVNGATTIFAQDPQSRALLDYNGSGGAISNWYAFGSGPNDALNQVGASTRATYVPDIQGSIIASLDAASGALTKAGFQPFGESATTSGTFRFTGARIDAETNGLYDFRARIYSPALGRFLQTDPIGTNGGPNLYAYVYNDPLNLIDPYGLAADGPGGSVSNSNGTSLSFLAPTIGATTSAGEGAAGGGAVSVLAAPTALATAILLATTTSTAGPEQDQVQFVVRGGAGAASSFQAGTALTQNGYGFSVQTAPNVPVDELARGGYFPNNQISVSTVQRLQGIPEVTVNSPTPGRGDYHGTVNVPNPTPEGFFNIISGAFIQQPNPYPTSR